MDGRPRGAPRGGPYGNTAHSSFVNFTRDLGRKRERGDWGDASGFGNPPPNKIPRPRLGEEMLRVLTRSSVRDSAFVKNMFCTGG